MSERIKQELVLLQEAYPDLKWHPDALWARIPSYPLPDGVWTRNDAGVAFQMPAQLPGQAPYGFWVHPGLELKAGGTISNYTYPVGTPFGDGWGQFSWTPAEWRPGSTVRAGTNMLDWVRSFAVRLAEGA